MEPSASRPMQEANDQAVLAAFGQQVGWCDRLGSPFTARLLELLADDVHNNGPTADLVGGWPGDPVADALPLRLAGGLHALVLAGMAPALAACYPPLAAPDATRLWPVLRGAVIEHAAFLRDVLRSPPQTNEVGRSAVLLGGFLHIAAAAGLPLHLLEIGASAGLNLVWDSYAYRLGGGHWGDATSPLVLAPDWQGNSPPLDAKLSVAERAACDVAPIDLEDDAQRLRLRSYVWPDQRDRLARLDAAIAVARRAGHRVARANAATWVRGKLAALPEGCATVLYHSVMWQYMPASDQARIADSIAQAGTRASPAAPFAWLRFEPAPGEVRMVLSVTRWPGGDERRLALAHPHGSSVTWLGG